MKKFLKSCLFWCIAAPSLIIMVPFAIFGTWLYNIAELIAYMLDVLEDWRHCA